VDSLSKGERACQGPGSSITGAVRTRPWRGGVNLGLYFDPLHARIQAIHECTCQRCNEVIKEHPQYLVAEEPRYRLRVWRLLDREEGAVPSEQAPRNQKMHVGMPIEEAPSTLHESHSSGDRRARPGCGLEEVPDRLVGCVAIRQISHGQPQRLARLPGWRMRDDSEGEGDLGRRTRGWSSPVHISRRVGNEGCNIGRRGRPSR